MWLNFCFSASAPFLSFMFWRPLVVQLRILMNDSFYHELYYIIYFYVGWKITPRLEFSEYGITILKINWNRNLAGLHEGCTGTVRLADSKEVRRAITIFYCADRKSCTWIAMRQLVLKVNLIWKVENLERFFYLSFAIRSVVAVTLTEPIEVIVGGQLHTAFKSMKINVCADSCSSSDLMKNWQLSCPNGARFDSEMFQHFLYCPSKAVSKEKLNSFRTIKQNRTSLTEPTFYIFYITNLTMQLSVLQRYQFNSSRIILQRAVEMRATN